MPESGWLRARLPLEALISLAASPDIRAVMPAEEPVHSAINVSQGDVAHRSDYARTILGATGAGVKIGVVSDGVASLASVQASGDLPAVTIISRGGIPQTGTGTEGTAMLEIVHDLAPDAQLLFATGAGGAPIMAANIRELQAQGAQIIVDDLIYRFSEPMFQDGEIAQAINDGYVDGVMHFSAAGNMGNQARGTSGIWEGDFVDSGIQIPTTLGNRPLHQFAAGPTVGNAIGPVNAGEFILRWADPWGAATSDYDLCIANATLTDV
jgi:hypothetical protein